MSQEVALRLGALMKFSDSGEETLTTACSQKMVEQRNFEL